MKKVVRSRWFIGIICLLLGAIIILAIRFATYNPEKVHYHANFAVYINGQRETFNNPKYYVETAICSADKIAAPGQRAHMHDNVNSVIHVHDHAVTWGQFFANLGWALGPDFIETDANKIYQENDTAKLNLILNGQDYTDLTDMSNRVIGDRDRLLISYGNESQAALQQQYKTVPATAKHYDESQDPASCAGSENPTFHDRLGHMF